MLPRDFTRSYKEYCNFEELFEFLYDQAMDFSVYWLDCKREFLSRLKDNDSDVSIFDFESFYGNSVRTPATRENAGHRYLVNSTHKFSSQVRCKT